MGLIFDSSVKKIKQTPGNHDIAKWAVNRWICEPSPAADDDLCIKAMLVIKDLNNRYETDGQELIKRINDFARP